MLTGNQQLDHSLISNLRRRQDRLEQIHQARKKMESEAAAAARHRQEGYDLARALADAAKQAELPALNRSVAEQESQDGSSQSESHSTERDSDRQGGWPGTSSFGTPCGGGDAAPRSGEKGRWHVELQYPAASHRSRKPSDEVR